MSKPVSIRQRPVAEALLPDLRRRLDSEVLARIYAARNAGAEHLDLGLKHLQPPFDLPGIGAAVDLLEQAIRQRQRILVLADYDADGATSCALAIRALRAMGAEQPLYLVPNRFVHGYGLTPGIVQLASRQRPDLLITVDSGISSLDGVAAAKALGMRVLITDHHLPGALLPEADAIVNPKLTQGVGEHLAGVGVVFYLMLALRARLRESGWFGSHPQPPGRPPEPGLVEWLDLVALGTVADVVPLDYNNRILVHQGLRRINRGLACPGVAALLEVGRRKPDELLASDLGFAVGPRLNAAGRLEDMSLGIACLLSDEPAHALELAGQLNDLNQTRRTIEADMVEQAAAILEQTDAPVTDALVHCLYHEDWHQGVIGILASRVKDKTGRPVVAFANAGGELRGSARSVVGIHIRDALAAVSARHPDLLQKFGGHAMAAGLTLGKSHLPAFTRALEEAIKAIVYPYGQLLANDTWTDGNLDEPSLELARGIETGGPWGAGFEEPVFTGGFQVTDARIVGVDHLKLRLRTRGGVAVNAIAFGQGDWLGKNHGKGEIEAIFSLKINKFYDEHNVELQVKRLLPSGSS